MKHPLDVAFRCRLTVFAVLAFLFPVSATLPAGSCVAELQAAETPEAPTLSEITVKSSIDGTQQPSLVWIPEAAKTKPTPLFVFLHSWSGDYRQDNSAWIREAHARGWVILHPNFRGRNDHPEACGSKLARQDIIDAMGFLIANYKIDPTRVYLAGSSGGGHMSMLMAGYFPDRFSAVSAWVGISDIAEWYRFHAPEGVPANYARMILASLGAAPGTSDEIDADYRDRSPLFHLHNAGKLPLDLNAGVTDGHTGSVPVSHTLKAFNVIAGVHNAPKITDAEMAELWNDQKLSAPQPNDTVPDANYGRDIHLRRQAGVARVTIFQGGHESIPSAGCQWLAKQQRKTVVSHP